MVPDGTGNITVGMDGTGAYSFSSGFQLVDTTPQAIIKTFTFPGYGAATILGSSINITKNYTVTVNVRPIADPQFTLTAPATWDGRQTIAVQSTITNQALLETTGGTNVNYHWSVAWVAVTQQIAPGTLTLTRAQGNGPMTVTLTMDNGGFAISHSVTVNVQQPASDAWVQRTPDANEKPVPGQFFARDDTGKGTIYYNGTVTNLVCGDAYIIEGQSNAEAPAPGTDTTGYSSPWIRTYVGGWGDAVRQGTNWIGYWGMDLAIQLLADYNRTIPTSATIISIRYGLMPAVTIPGTINCARCSGPCPTCFPTCES